MGDPTYGSLDYYDTWPLLQLRYLLVYLFEYGATAGIVDVAYTHPDNARPDYLSCWGADELPYLSHCDGLMYIRMNVLGAFVTGITDQFGAPEEKETFDAKGEILYYAGSEPVAPDCSFFLDKIADRISADQWRISTLSLLNAVNADASIKEIEIFLTTLNPVLIPLWVQTHHALYFSAFVQRPGSGLHPRGPGRFFLYLNSIFQ